mmetsp:Transcript_16920/g.31585  ORF Transcript_16920/g.31585 Transcript_16920/m.31585 type:complete len:195 (+) Transcript_16920:74-658(+)
MPLRVHLPNGEEIDTSSVRPGCEVARARRELAKVLGVASDKVHLLIGNSKLEDAQILQEAADLTAVVSSIPIWYPPGKYVFKGKDVLKTVQETYSGRHGEEVKMIVHYTDGSSECRGIWKSTSGESLRGQQQLSEMQDLVLQWAFVSHKVESTWPGGTITTCESVPLEDTAEWESFKRNTGMKCLQGERRKVPR